LPVRQIAAVHFRPSFFSPAFSDDHHHCLAYSDVSYSSATSGGCLYRRIAARMQTSHSSLPGKHSARNGIVRPYKQYT